MNNKYLWVIGALIGMGIGNILWKNSKIYKRHLEEMKKSEEETNRIIEQMVKDSFPKPNFEDRLHEQLKADAERLDAMIEQKKRELEEAKANDEFKAEIEAIIRRANRAADIY